MNVNWILVAVSLILALVVYFQHRRRRQMFNAVVSDLVTLFKSGAVTSFGYGVEQYENEHEWLDYAFLSGDRWVFWEKDGASNGESRNAGDIPREIWMLHSLIRWMPNDVEALFDYAAIALDKEDNHLLKVVKGKHNQAGAPILTVGSLAAAQAA